jgi:restriction system protein
MAYRQDPYMKLDSEWRSYDLNFQRYSDCVGRIQYDGYVRNFNYCPDPTSREVYYGALTSFFVERPKVLGEVFILPRDYAVLSFQDLLTPTATPRFPPHPTPPEILLPLDRYPDWYHQYIARDRERREEKLSDAEQLYASVREKERAFRELYDSVEAEVVGVRARLAANPSDAAAQAAVIRIALMKHDLPPRARAPYAVMVSSADKIAAIQFKFPDYAQVRIAVGHKGAKKKELKFASDAQKRKLVKQCLCSLLIRAAYLAAKFRQAETFSSVVVNVEQDWFDPATGQPRNGVIASLQAPVQYLESLDLSKLDPEAAVKHLKGILTPSVDNLSPIRPIFVLDTADDRLVASKDVAGDIEADANLAAMEWEDFEHLVAQLFEWEFSKGGAQVRVTRASRDRGVDAILFDPDPIRGGKYVIQAKRYTRTVDVSAVRDLYGTVMNEGANRGILISTANFGPDAYEFSKDKPISLIDGQNLVQMLNRHGKKYRIDLEEARRLNKLQED